MMKQQMMIKENLTKENLIFYIENYLNVSNKINFETELRSEFDGDDAIELLSNLSSFFGIDFSRFNFMDYFLSEIEISKSISWFGLKKIRKIKKELTVGDLYDYMIENINR